MRANAFNRRRGLHCLPLGHCAGVLVTLILATGRAPLVAAAGYTIADLAQISAPGAEGILTSLSKPWVSINNNGQVAISGQPGLGIGYWAARYYSSGQTTVLSPPYFKAFGLDSSGNIVGGKDYEGIGIYTSVAVWHPDGTTTVLGQPDDGGVHNIATSAAFAANEQGTIVGGSDPFGHEFGGITGGILYFAYSRSTHAFMFDQGVFHDLGTLGGNYSLAYEINNNGRIVGMSTTAEPTNGVPAVFHAAYSDGGALQDLNSLVGPSDWTLQSATDINDAGLITGWGTIDGQTRAYLFNSGVVHMLDVLPGYDFSIGRGINASGDVVGYSATGEIGGAYFVDDAPFYHFLTSTGEDRAFLYRNGTMYDLNSFVAPASGWTIHGATDINDSGQIVGWGTLAGEPDYVIHALLLTPVPEPSGLMLVVFAIAAVLNMALLSRRRG